MNKRLDLAGAVLVVLGALLLHGPMVNLWWTYDDFFHLHHVLTHRAADYIVSPKLWQELPNAMYTPLQFLSYEADVFLFGLKPSAFYVHQLVVFAAAMVLFFFLLRLWFSFAPSLFGSLILECGVPLVSSVQLLMVRHYIEGLLLAILSAWMFVVSLRKGRRGLLFASAALYFLAASAKEVYVPLPFILAILPESTFRHRVRNLIPHFFALVLYLGLRWLMLGSVMAGYGWAVRPGEIPGLALSLPGKLVAAFLPSDPVRWVLAPFLLAASIACFFVARRLAMFAAMSFLMAAATIFPVSTVMEPRFAVLPWLFVVVAVTGVMSKLVQRSGWRRGFGWTGAFGLLILSLYAHGVERDRSYSLVRRMSREGMFFLSMDDGWLRKPAIPPAAMVELTWLKEHLGRPNKAGWFYDDLFLCLNKVGERVWSYDQASLRMLESTTAIPSLSRSFCSGIRWQAPLRASFEKVGRQLFWTLGPYDDGSYGFVFDQGRQLFEMPRKAGFQIGDQNQFKLRIRYSSDDGMVTYSPELLLDFTKSRSLRWER